MDALTIIIMIVLFILAMLFVFSTALLTPYIGKKNLISVILLGLIVGLAGGAFLLSPIVGDLPDFTRTIVEESTVGSDVVTMDISTNTNLTQTIQNITAINGVEKLDYQGIIIKIDEEFDSDYERNLIMQALNNSNENITNVVETQNNTFLIKIKEGGDPQGVLASIYNTFKRETYTHLRYTSMQANATVKANNVTKIMEELSKNNVVIQNVTGPTETEIAAISKILPNETNIILVSGVIGVLVAIAGFFVDSLITFINNFRKKRKKKPSEREKIKRKVVPGTEMKGSPRRNRNRNRKIKESKGNSIDIFNESFDESPKQNIGSNKNFKQLTDEDLKTKKISEKESRSRFSFRRSSKSDEKKQSGKENKSSDKRKSPKFRPKRKE